MERALTPEEILALQREAEQKRRAREAQGGSEPIVASPPAKQSIPTVEKSAEPESAEEARTVMEPVLTRDQIAALKEQYERSVKAQTPSAPTPPQEPPVPPPPRKSMLDTQRIPVGVPAERPHAEPMPPSPPAGGGSEAPPTLIVPMPEMTGALSQAESLPAPPPGVKPPAQASARAPAAAAPHVTYRSPMLWGVLAGIGIVVIAFGAFAAFRAISQRGPKTDGRREAGLTASARLGTPAPAPVPPLPTTTAAEPPPPPAVQATDQLSSGAPATSVIAPPPETTAAVAKEEQVPPPVKKKPARKKAVVSPPPPQPEVAPVQLEPPPPPPVQEGDLGTLGEAGVVPPELTADVEPKYPVRARLSGASGEVELNLLIDHHGKVEDVKVVQSSGNPHLDNSAITAAKKTRFKPATKNGVPVRIWITRHYIFRAGS